jgi:hypothetical protein
MKNLSLLLVALGLAVSAVGQSAQGIRGMVVFKRGNFMPGPRVMPKGQLVKREIYVYELTKMAQMKATTEGFYEEVGTKLVKKGRSDAKGRFRIALPPGRYSVLVKEPNKGLYANVFDGDMNAFPVEVKPGRFTTVSLEINYAAVY